MKGHSTKKRTRRNKDLGYIHASKLVGRDILLLGFVSLGQPHPYFKWAVAARLSNGQQLHFPAGVVVEDQIRNAPVLPVWAKLIWAKGTKHPYYKLLLAQIIDWKRAKPKRTKSEAVIHKDCE
jgi:hypothetical protein